MTIHSYDKKQKMIRYGTFLFDYNCNTCEVSFQSKKVYFKEVTRTDNSTWMGIGMQLSQRQVQKSVIVLKRPSQNNTKSLYAVLEAVSTKSKKSFFKKDPFEQESLQATFQHAMSHKTCLCKQCDSLFNMSAMKFYLRIAEMIAFEIWQVKELILQDAATIVLADQNFYPLSVQKMFQKGQSIQELYGQKVMESKSSPKLQRRLCRPFKTFPQKNTSELIQELQEFRKSEQNFKSLDVEKAIQELTFKENSLHLYSANLLDCFICKQAYEVFQDLTETSDCQKLFQFWYSRTKECADEHKYDNIALETFKISSINSQQIPQWLEKYTDRWKDVQ